MANEASEPASDFIRDIIAEDLRTQKHAGRVITRFPPEPNGYLHIGHAKSICLNFGIAAEHDQGACHLRFDDTNPTTEEVQFVEAIQDDIRWLGFDWGDKLFHASDYFERLHAYAVDLITRGKAYVCSLTEEEFGEYRGTVKSAGKPSPYRDRPVDENIDLFTRMRAGEFDEGAHVLRAKIDMASLNMKMRDPPIYRIRKASHHRTGDQWSIYPLYDFAHCLSDSIEGITHSLCTLEFENNRELYDWILDALETPCHPQQIEFARLNLTHTVTSKRKLQKLVADAHVTGWDDPRLPTIAGMRRRGVTPEAIRAFCQRIGIAKTEGTVEMQLFDHILRDDLNHRVPRAMCVLRPLKLVIDNFPEDLEDEFEFPNFPDDPPLMGSRKVPFAREVWIERTDFMEDAPKKFFRLAPGREVRLRWAWLVTCTDVVKDPETGEVVEIHCTYDPESRGGNPADGRRVKGTIHWVSARHGVPAEVRLYGHLFSAPYPGSDGEDADFLADLNPESLEVISDAMVEPSLTRVAAGARYQFERTGYFCADQHDHTTERPVFNRTVALRDSWAKIAKGQKRG